MNWQVSDLIKIKERKSPAQPSKGQKNHWEPKNKTGGIPRDSHKPRILGTCSRVRLGLRRFKGACQETQGTRIDVSLLATQWCKKGIRRLRNQQFMSKGLVPWRTQEGKKKKKTTKEGGLESFSLTERNQLTWEKWQKGKQPKGGI